MARHDLPAMLKFVVAKTSQPSLFYVGHSQGTLIAFAEFSRNKELAKMVKKFFALGPVATVGHMESPIKYLSYFLPEIQVLYTIRQLSSFLSLHLSYASLHLRPKRNTNIISNCWFSCTVTWLEQRLFLRRQIFSCLRYSWLSKAKVSIPSFWLVVSYNRAKIQSQITTSDNTRIRATSSEWNGRRFWTREETFM